MHRYDVAGHVRPIAGRGRALLAARVEAARTGEAVTVYELTRHERIVHTTVFPDGSSARPGALHRLPQAFAL